MGPPHYGWPVGLSTYLHVKYGGKWAYSGSFAMYCHADALGLDCREPDDIDILIKGATTMMNFTMSNVCALAYDLQQDFRGSPASAPNMVATKATINNCVFRAGTAGVKIDLGSSSAQFGDVDNDTVSYDNQSISWKILKVGKLIETKKRALSMGGSDKHTADLVTLKAFLERTGH